jgi:hypothetical protein
MTDKELTKALGTLKTQADRLNAASNEINALIENIEAQIAATNVGVDCWIEIDRGNRLEPYHEQDPHHLRTIRYPVTELGWMKLGNHWRLVVRELVDEYRENVDLPGEFDEYVDTLSATQAIALLSTARSVRIAALRQLPNFIDRLAKAAAQATDTIEEAKKLIAD